MTAAPDLDLARDAVDRHAWSEAVELLAAADASGPLGIDDVERLALALHMVGRRDDAIQAWERAHLAALRGGDPVRAVRNAFQLVMAFGERGEVAQAGGWHARASRLLDEAGGDHVERGMLLVPAALLARQEGRVQESLALFEEVAAIAGRFGDAEGRAMSCFGRGETLIALGDVERGLALLDEAMVSVTAGEVSPMNVGVVYCGSIEAFQAVFDLGRAQEWTAALERWTEAEPDVITYRGRCRVFRSELLQLHGQWQDAVAEVALARDWLLRPPPAPAVGEAYYQQAELARLRGEFTDAEAAYREGAAWGRRPDPGLALLRLAQGEAATAAAMIRRALDEVDPIGTPRLLEPAVEVLLAVGDLPGARSAVAQLEELVGRGPQRPWPRALASEAEGRVRLAAGDPTGALAALRRAEGLWRTLDAPYETARVQVAIAQACRELGDDETATIELAAARDVFDRLGAVPDRQRVDQLAGTRPPVPGGLSPRELEVVRLVAGGSTNREIAERLGISERTVDRHVSNILAKLDVASRAGATAFAYEHRLV